MPGRIRDEDIAVVREKTRIDEVVSQYVTLRSAGGGSYKGLCPFHDEKTPSFNVNPSRGYYHCLAGETEVLTWSGARPIRELAGGVHRVLNARGDWVEAPFRSYGVQRLMKVVVSRNRQTKELYATDEHRWMLRTGVGDDVRRERLTKDLTSGDRLWATYPRSRIARTTPSPFGIAHGFTYGDGTLSGDGSTALICPPKDQAMLKWFPNSHTTASGPNLLVHHLPRFFKHRPDLDESRAYLLGWLAGYFAADGCVAADGTVVVNSAHRDDLEFVRAVCTRLGIATDGITCQMRTGTGATEPSALYRVHLVNDDLPARFFLIPAHRERFERAEKTFSRTGWVVTSIEWTDRVEEVYCAEVEDGHAFTLVDNILTGNCFGCQKGGDVISFLMDVDGLSFTETVERLADSVGVQLRYEEGTPDRPTGGPKRSRLVEAHKIAQEYYAGLLATPEALTARQFLGQRGFDQAAAATFGVGFSPRGGEDLYHHLKKYSFSDEEVVASGLVGLGRGHYDRFRGRLMWPIRDTSGATIGFGARRIFDDDRIEAKYLNTPETAIYKKSQVLYGVDLARQAISRTSQAVVVEGYTDVMACHLSGVQTAVASCGTAFGEEHTRLLRRLLHDHEEFRGEVIFTFDGDQAGQDAAMKAFQGDQRFVSQTYVAVEPDGLDPCDLRLAKGDEAVRELVARRQPLYRFVLANVVRRFDLDRADGRVDALREGAKLVTSIRDRSKVDAFVRELAGMVGIDPDDARREVRRVADRRSSAPASAAQPPAQRPADTGGMPVPDPRDPRLVMERETLKLVMQHPLLVAPAAGDVDADDFRHPAHRALWEIVTRLGGPAAARPSWVADLAGATEEPVLRGLISSLAVEPINTAREPDAGYAAQHVYRLQELTVQRRIADLKSRLQRTTPGNQDYNRTFGELVALEQQRRSLRELAVGGA